MDNQNINPMQPQPAAPAPAPAPQPAPAPAPAAAPQPMAAAPAPAKKKSKVGLIIGIIVGLLVLVGAVIGIIALVSNGGGEEDDIYATNVYFLPNDDEKYALFNDDGERLTDFVYGYASRFIGGTALVKDENNDKVGIVNTEAKMTVDFGKYRYITRVGGLYEASDDDLNDYIINGKGKVIYDLKKNRLITYDDSFAIIADDKGFQVLNYKGAKILSLTENLDKEIKLSSEKDSYVVVFHAGTNYVINAMTAEVIGKFEAKNGYRVTQVDKEDNIIFMREDNDDDDDEVKYKFVVKGEIRDLPGGCESVSYLGKRLYCYKNSKSYVLDADFNVGIEARSAEYVDSKNYVKDKEDSKSYGVNFYKDGTVAGSVDCRSIAYYGAAESGFYLLMTRRTYTSGSKCYDETYGDYEYYTVDGKKAFGDKKFDVAELFSAAGTTRVRDNDSGKYYVMNTKGEKVSNEYKYLYSRSVDETKFFYGYDSYDSIDVLTPQGKKLTTTTSSYSMGGEIYEDKLYIYVRDSEKKIYNIFRAEDGEKIAESENYPSFTDHYIKVEANDKVQYYTYAGKLIHEHKD